MGLQKKKIVILGAGPAGLNVGRLLALQGHQVVILEKDLLAGGLCQSFSEDGYSFDLGPHNIHTQRQSILSFLRSFLKGDLLRNQSKIKILFNNHFVQYPLRGLNVFKALRNPILIFVAFFDFIKARLCMFLFRPKAPVSFQEWIINQFGRTLYHIYFEPYAKKAWKVDPDQIDVYVARKRVPVFSIRDYIKSMLKLPSSKFHSEDWTKIESYYPRYGVGQVARFLESEFLAHGGTIEFGIQLKQIKKIDNKIQGVEFSKDGKDFFLAADFVFSTIPVNDLMRLFTPGVGSDVLNAVDQLDFCAEKLLYIKVKRETVFDTLLVYFQSPKIKFNRVYDVRRFSPWCVPQGKDMLCVEFTCSLGDEVWKTKDAELFEEAISVFEANGILTREDTDGFFVRDVAHAYPRFRIGFQQRIEKVFKYIDAVDNLMVLGRQGLFCYANLDDVLDMGFKAVASVSSGDWNRAAHAKIFGDYLNLPLE